MTPPEFDRLLKDAADSQPGPDPGLVEKIERGILPDIRPSRRMISAGVLSVILVLGSTALALAASTLLGQAGLHLLSAFQGTLIFGTLGVLLWLASRSLFAEMVPASAKLTSPARLAAWSALALAALFLELFPDRSRDDFVHRGANCLGIGLIVAVVAGALAALWLRRGLVLDAARAGAAAGLVGALAGILTLQLHCPYQQPPHLLWHVMVIPVAAAAAAWIGGIRSRS